MVELQQQREKIFDRTQKFEDNMKDIFDKTTKPDEFQLGDVVFLWDAPHEEKWKHGKLYHMWKHPYKISNFIGRNAYLLDEMEGGIVSGAHVNGRLLKHYFM